MHHDAQQRPRSNTLDVLTLGALATAALVAYLLMNHLLVRSVVAEFASRGLLKSSVYVLWLACGFASFLAVLLTVRKPGLFLVSLVLCVSVAINYVYAGLLSRAITPDHMEWMVHEFQRLPQAWGEFKSEIVLATAKALVLLITFLTLRALMLRHKLIHGSGITHPRARAIAVLAFLGFHGAVMLIQPTYAAAETNVIVFGLPACFKQAPKRLGVPGHLQAAPRVDKIVLIVDESVNHEVYADIIARRLRHLPVVDFGEAASVSACSAPSNALLRWGVEQSRIREAGYDPRENPTIWKFARQAGFKTTLIDGQSIGLAHNFLSIGELALIDEFIPAATGTNSDHRIAAMLNERLSRPGRELIYIVKRGSHFPYEQNYPGDMIPRDSPRTLKYAAAVNYATGGFFELLAKDMPLSNLLLVYTSDHGQVPDSRVTHCSREEHRDEYSVPLMVLSEAPSVKMLLGSALPAMRGRASHLNIFPTLLYGLGYPRDWIEATYGPTLAGPPAPYVRVGTLPYPTDRSKSVGFVTTYRFPGRAQK